LIACLTWARWTDGWAGWLGVEAVIWGDWEGRREGEGRREKEKVAGSGIGYVLVRSFFLFFYSVSKRCLDGKTV
jgi:hypothetical protein